MSDRIQERPVFERLLFSQCWEDPALDIEALRPRSGGRYLVVTSGGCTALSLLTAAPCEVVALDLSAAQGHLLALKAAGIRALSHEEYLKLLGVRFAEEPDPRGPSSEVLYDRVRGLLPAIAREYWDRHTREIRRGVLDAGRYERYLAMFRRLLGVLMGRRTLRELFRQSRGEQERFYRRRWDRPAWRWFFRVFFSRALLGRGGLDPAFFRYVDGVPSFGEHFRWRAEHALTMLPIRENYFLSRIVLGRYLHRRAVPPYLHPRHFGALRRRVHCVRVVTGELGAFLREAAPASFDGFALSNVFEWVDEPAFRSLLDLISRAGKPGARLCYRNLLVPRERPVEMADRLGSHAALGSRLLARDRSFVYRRLVVEEVRGQPVGAAT